MKKRILTAVLAAVTVLTVGCGTTDNSSDNDKTLTPATQQATVSEADTTGFTILPDNASKALDLACEGSKKAYPTTDEQRSLGYSGKSKVNDTDCYCFSAFNTKQEQTYYIADVAVAADYSKVYVSDAGKKQYKELNLTSDADTNWSDTKTPAFAK